MQRLLPLKHGVLCCVFGMSLIACQEKYTESYYFSHPSVLNKVLTRCQSSFTTDCRTAYHAAQNMTQLSRSFAKNQAAFGQRILRAQIRWVALSQKLKLAQPGSAEYSSRQQQCRAQQRRVQDLLAIVGLFVRI